MHLTIARSEVGVSGMMKGVEVTPGFCGVGSSSRTSTAGTALGSPSIRRFLEWNGWNGVESAFWSSSSDSRIG